MDLLDLKKAADSAITQRNDNPKLQAAAQNLIAIINTENHDDLKRDILEQIISILNTQTSVPNYMMRDVTLGKYVPGGYEFDKYILSKLALFFGVILLAVIILKIVFDASLIVAPALSAILIISLLLHAVMIMLYVARRVMHNMGLDSYIMTGIPAAIHKLKLERLLEDLDKELKNFEYSPTKLQSSNVSRDAVKRRITEYKNAKIYDIVALQKLCMLLQSLNNFLPAPLENFDSFKTQCRLLFPKQSPSNSIFVRPEHKLQSAIDVLLAGDKLSVYG